MAAVMGHSRAELPRRQTPLRPILTSINGNVAWILSFPRPQPQSPTTAATSTKAYHHVVVDPWFGDLAVAGSRLVIGMTLENPPALKSKADIDEAIREIEAATGEPGTLDPTSELVDAILVTGAVEHCSKPALLQFSPATPVYVTDASIASVLGWKHFDAVVRLIPFEPSAPTGDDDGSAVPWKSGHTGPPLPDWLTIAALKVGAFNNFVVALVTTAAQISAPENSRDGEAILVAAHGVYATEPALQTLLSSPRLRLLAHLAPYGDSYTAGFQSTCGVADGLAVAQVPEHGMRYYVHSGDPEQARLSYVGVLSWLLRFEDRTLEWGVRQLREGKGGDGIVYGEDDAVAEGCRKIKMPKEVVVGNGTSFVLV
ncbi:hypothetical protein MN608_00028 [Microdochium nivale]|nr:hypothetical protein MN608_00028 [Microdochium nivale]